MKVAPENFTTATEFARANAAVSFLKKNPFVKGSSLSERRAKASQSWKQGEASCYAANERLSRHLISPLSGDIPSEFLRRVRRRLLSWLRHAPDDDELMARCRHGPGTTFSSTVVSPTAADKYSDVMTLTHETVWYLPYVFGTLWGTELSRKVQPMIYTRGNRHTLVPKTALTDRSIAIEATFNIWLQLGIGGSIRDRLRRFAGWDLDHAATTHREMAQYASVSGFYSTLDLTNASDSLCKNLVRVLLRDTSWLSLLEDLRSTRTFFEGKWHLLEKFSSMGNGYTFELETAIFAAVSSVCLELKGYEGKLGQDLFVFGDDIIIPSECAEIVTSTLAWLGFEINLEKSFTTGPFRESCGGDYFLGAPVRGYYLKDKLDNDPSRFFSLYNGAKACLERCGVNPSVFLGWVLSHLPERLRALGGPSRLGDTVLHGLPEVFKWKNGIRWTKTAVFSEPKVVPWGPFSENVRLACRLTGYGDSRGVTSRGVYRILRTRWVSTS